MSFNPSAAGEIRLVEAELPFSQFYAVGFAATIPDQVIVLQLSGHD